MRPLNAAQCAELARLHKRHHGHLLADHVWQAARNKSNPLHSKFKWNVQEAAVEHWRDTARRILQVWVVVSAGGDPIRAVVSLRERSNPGYYDPLKLDPDSLVRLMVDDLGSLMRRHAYLETVAPRPYKSVVRLHNLLAARYAKAEKQAAG